MIRRLILCRVLGWHKPGFRSHEEALDWLMFGRGDIRRCRRCGR